MNLHEGTLINEGTLRFKEDGLFHLHGNNVINKRKIKGIQRLDFVEGGVFNLKSDSQVKIKKGQFSYKGQEMVSHPDSFMKAQMIQVKTTQDLNTLPKLTGSLKAEAPCVRNTQEIGSRGDIHFRAHEILNEASLGRVLNLI